MFLAQGSSYSGEGADNSYVESEDDSTNNSRLPDTDIGERNNTEADQCPASEESEDQTSEKHESDPFTTPKSKKRVRTLESVVGLTKRN